MTYPNSETLTRIRPSGTSGGKDRFGNPKNTPPADETDVTGCVIWPEGALGEQTFEQDTTIAGYQALLPAGTAATATDQWRWRGDLYDTYGEPQHYSNPFTGTDPGVLITLRRTKG